MKINSYLTQKIAVGATTLGFFICTSTTLLTQSAQAASFFLIHSFDNSNTFITTNLTLNSFGIPSSVSDVTGAEIGGTFDAYFDPINASQILEIGTLGNPNVLSYSNNTGNLASVMIDYKDFGTINLSESDRFRFNLLDLDEDADLILTVNGIESTIALQDEQVGNIDFGFSNFTGVDFTAIDSISF